MKKVVKLIKQELKEKLGLNNRHVSVKEMPLSYNRVYYVTIKSYPAYKKKDEIKKICSRFEKVDRCDKTYDGLSGGNVYINVSVDTDLKRKLNELVCKL